MNSKNKTNLWVNKSFREVFFSQVFGSSSNILSKWYGKVVWIEIDFDSEVDWKRIQGSSILSFLWRYKFYISENLECRVEKWLKFCSIFKNFLKICIKLKILRNFKHNPINPIWNQNCKNILDHVKFFKQTFIRDSNTCFSALII